MLNPATPEELRYDLCLANLAKLFFWLGWLRATEAFSLRCCNIDCIPPQEAASRGLPPQCGAFLLQLLEYTKSPQSSQVDVIIASRTASDFDIGAC
jgi:hypothetical protein